MRPDAIKVAYQHYLTSREFTETPGAKVANRYLKAVSIEEDLPTLEKALLNLENLDMTLTAIEDTYNDHMTGKVASVDIPDVGPYVTSQLESLTKSQEGLKAALQIEASVKQILVMDPENKTAQRTATDAATMVKRFKKHEEEARAMIRDIAKKKTPPALKKMGDAVLKILKTRLVDPESVTMIPWVDPKTHFYTGGSMSPKIGVGYLLVFSFPGVEKANRPTLVESTISNIGVELIYSNTSTPATDPKIVTDLIVKYLGEWNGIKGKAEEGAGRAELAKTVLGIMESMGRRLGEIRRDESEVLDNNRNLSVTFRTNLRTENYGEYDDEWQEIVSREYTQPLKKALASYMDKIKSVGVENNEKGYWSFYVTLK